MSVISAANVKVFICVFTSAEFIWFVFRNLSCGDQDERKKMRDTPGLIDSLMSYIQSCVAEEKPDDKVTFSHQIPSIACICEQDLKSLRPLGPSDTSGIAETTTVIIHVLVGTCSLCYGWIPVW